MLQENFTVQAARACCAPARSTAPSWPSRSRTRAWPCAPLYDEPFLVAVPQRTTRWPTRKHDQRRGAQAGDHAAAGHRPLLPRPRAGGVPRVRRASRSDAEGIRKTFEGSSLETIKHMVASRHGRDRGAAQLGARPEGRRNRHACATCRSRDPVPTRPRGAGVAPQLHALRGHRRAAQRHLCLPAARRESACHWEAPSQGSARLTPSPDLSLVCSVVRLFRSNPETPWPRN